MEVNFNIVVNNNDKQDDKVGEVLKKIDETFGNSVSNITINLTIIEQ